MRSAILALAVLLGGCSTSQVDKFKAWSVNYREVIKTVNADIAATAPAVAAGCADLQKYAMLIGPFLESTKAGRYFDAANDAIGAYCAVVPTDIQSTAVAVARAVVAAKAGYNEVAR